MLYIESKAHHFCGFSFSLIVCLCGLGNDMQTKCKNINYFGGTMDDKKITILQNVELYFFFYYAFFLTQQCIVWIVSDKSVRMGNFVCAIYFQEVRFIQLSFLLLFHFIIFLLYCTINSNIMNESQRKIRVCMKLKAKRKSYWKWFLEGEFSFLI